MAMNLKTETIDGRKVQISVDGYGKFTAACDGDEWTANTLDDVFAKVRAALRKQKVRLAIKATALGVQLVKPKYGAAHSQSAEGKVRHCVITGIHGKTGNVMVKWEDSGESEQISGWRSEGDLCRRLTDAQVKLYASLSKAKCQAVDALEAFEKSVRLGGRRDIKTFVEAEVEKAKDDPKEPEVDESGDPR